MFIFLFCFSFLFLFLIFLSKNNEIPVFTNLRLSLVKSLLVISFLVFLFTEILSFINEITLKGVFTCWGISLVVLFLLFFYKYKVDFGKFLKSLKHHKIYINRNYVLVIIASLLFIVIPLLFIALYYPPNNADSLGYHLPRIEHWIQNRNIDHYPVGDVRQLFYQPFSEYVVLHLRLLIGGDYLANMVQFFAMVGSIILLTLIVKLFGLDYKFQILTALLGLSIPMGMLQATSTQTDYITAFFLAAFIFFCLYLIKKRRELFYSNIFWLSLSLSLGFLTKLTIGIFALPFCIWFGLSIFKKYRDKYLKAGLIVITLLCLINLPFSLRNYNAAQNFLGSEVHSKIIKNNKMNIPYFFSNIIRNLSLHFAFPLANRVFNKGVDKFHQKFMGISSAEKDISFCDTEYEPFFAINEDVSGSFYLIFLMFAAMFYFFLNFRRFFYFNNKFLFFYFASLISGFLLFCFIFKWQPWHARLHLPFFVLAIPVVAYFIYDVFLNKKVIYKKTLIFFIMTLSFYWGLSFAIKDRRAFLILFLFTVIFFLTGYLFLKIKSFHKSTVILSIFIFSLPYVYFHRIRPLLRNKNLLFGSRELKYFRGNLEPYNQFISIADVLQKYKVNNIAIGSRGCFNEYLLWALLRNRFDDFELRHIFSSSEIINKTKNFKEDFNYRAVVSNVKDAINYYEKDNIEFYKEFGTIKDSLNLVIFKKSKVRHDFC